MVCIKLVKRVTSAVKAQMEKDLIIYEKSCGIDINYQSFSLILKCRGEIFGVLNAYTAFAEIYIDDIWVKNDHRNRGFGKKLIMEVEELFKDKGFNNINLVTSAFQAPAFYEKCGFELEFVRKNFNNPKLDKFFFIKYFENEIQNQGIVQKPLMK